jgi:TRAP-type C4-dicarboxylate transport system permease small subunit
MEVLISVIFIAMVIAGGLQVFNRFFLNQSLSWTEEFQKFAHIWLIFFTIPIAYNRGSHIGMKVIFNKFSKSWQKILNISFDILWMVLASVIAYYTIIIMGVTKSQRSAGLNLRMDRVYLGLVIGSLYLLITALKKLIRHFKNPNQLEYKTEIEGGTEC